jgi:hypothetical protein
LLSDIKGGTGTDGVCERGAEEDIWRPKRDEVKGGWIKLHMKELRDLYSSSSTVRLI